LFALGWASLCLAEGKVNVELQAPRPFGYVIGDVIPLQADIDTDAPYRLGPNTLPKPGPINRWLWLKTINTEQTQQGHRTHYRLRLEYQTFYAPLAVKNLTIPAMPLALEGPGEPLNAQIPAWNFSTAPLRGLAAAEENGQVAPRPEVEPKPLQTWPHWLGLTAWLGLAVAALAYLAYQSGWLNFGQRGRYFAEAIRTLRRLEAEGLPPEQQREAAYTAVHQAFNQTLGFALFSEGLPAFFAGHSRYAPLKTEIEAFFTASYSAFFGEEPAHGGFTLASLIGLCRECIRIEREGEQAQPNPIQAVAEQGGKG
jgi:mxaA protein